MTRPDLENLRNKHELAAKAAYRDCSFSDYDYEMGYVGALNYILEHFDALYLGQRRQSIVEDAEDHIYSYFESRYDGDDSDELPETLEDVCTADEDLAAFVCEAYKRNNISEMFSAIVGRDIDDIIDRMNSIPVETEREAAE